MLNELYRTMISGSAFGLFLQVVPIACLVGLVYAAYRYIRIKARGLQVQRHKEIMRWFFVCYLAGLFNLVLVPANLWSYIWGNIFVGSGSMEFSFFSGGYNFVPTLVQWIAGDLTVGRWVSRMLAYNFLMFLPLGFFLPFVAENIPKRKIWMLAIGVPIAVESLQPIIGRSFDVDDLILNFAGILTGYFIAAGLNAGKARICKKIRSRE